ncbi:hypothetical protein SeMB42_g03843 [Synchytrium endobioticum]|uniref:Uncharacterized protein n=1 Tax=Synchytrium endobioticum TaxID=286115 RepID=A0A507D3F6_9FUNG|nr:hypothetical protein SeMB42_g03843 [Synchytrium endobioticum]
MESYSYQQAGCHSGTCLVITLFHGEHGFNAKDTYCNTAPQYWGEYILATQRIDNIKSTPEGHTPTSDDGPISNNALGFRFGASTSQPRPCVLDGVTRGGGVDNQPQCAGVQRSKV